MSTFEVTNRTAHLPDMLQSVESAAAGAGTIATLPSPLPSGLNAATNYNSTAGDMSSNCASQLLNPMASTMDNGPVQAYAKLESDTFCYYIRTLQVMLGRRAGSADQVDIHLGSTKGISRQHARLFYNFLNQRFELIVYGKNGAFVNEQFIEKGSTVPLEHRTKVQIGETTFHFLLPKMELEDATHENYSYLSGTDEYLQDTKHPQSLQGHLPQANSLQSSSSQLQTQIQSETSGKTTHPRQKPEIRHLTTAATGSLVAANTMTECEQADGTRGTPREGEVFDTSEYSNKDVKPPFSYASLIAQAINTTPNKKLTLNGIYNYITSHYPYYQMAQNGWQNSIRHNLSLNKAFVKVPRGDNEPGKGAFWTIDASFEGQFRNGVYRKSRRQPSTKAGGSTGPVRPKAEATSMSPYNSPDPNRRRSTSSKSAIPAAGTAHTINSVAGKDHPAGVGIPAIQHDAPTGVKMPAAGTTSLLQGLKTSRDSPSQGVAVAYDASAIPNASSAAALTIPQVSSSYSSASPYMNSNISPPTSNAVAGSTTLPPALQLLTTASLSSPASATLATLNTKSPNMKPLAQSSLPPLSANTVVTPIPSPAEGLSAQRMTGASDSTISTSHSTVSGVGHNADATSTAP